MVDLDSLAATLKARAALAPKLGYRVKFEVKGEGTILLDGTVAPAEVTTEDGEADTTFSLSSATLKQLVEGQLNPTFAYMSGKLKISGSKGVAMKLAAFLED